MKGLSAALCVLGLATQGAAQDKPSGEETPSALLAKGPLQNVVGRLLPFVQFKVEGERLTLDRSGWPDPGAAAEPEPNERRRPNFSGREPPTPVDRLFEQLCEASKAGSGGFSGGAGGSAQTVGEPVKAGETNLIKIGEKTCPKCGAEIAIVASKDVSVVKFGDRHLATDSLQCRLWRRGESYHIHLQELKGPKRTFELVGEASGSFRLQFMHPDGDMVMIHQAESGRFTAMALSSGRIFAGHGKSFTEFLKQNHAEADAYLTPVFHQLGVKPFTVP